MCRFVKTKEKEGIGKSGDQRRRKKRETTFSFPDATQFFLILVVYLFIFIHGQVSEKY